MCEKKRNRKNRPARRALILFALFVSALPELGSASELQDLISANSKSQWNDAAEISFELVSANPQGAEAAAERLQGAYALFQKGYSNSALLWLKPLTASQWKSVPQGEDRFAEIISLFQKKVPLTLLPGRLDQIGLDQASPYLYDQIRFAKGREAFERGNPPDVISNLNAITKGSRYFAESQYILGAEAVKRGDYISAMTSFAKIFEPEVLDQSTEFWQDMSAQLTSHWGANLRVALNAQSVRDAENVGELGLLAMARVAYATHQYDQALTYFSRVSPESVDYPAAELERVWTLLALNRHDDAQKAAAKLAVNEKSFESVQARTVRALILTDAGRTNEAMAEIHSFLAAYSSAKTALQNYETTQVVSSLPDFLKNDLNSDFRLRSLKEYEDALDREATAMRKEDASLFPVYSQLASQLDPLREQARESIGHLIEEHVIHRRDDLETLYVQAKLITAEIYLEERRQLRVQYKNLPQTDIAKQAEHDRKLVELLQNAVDTVDEVLPRVQKNRVRLLFRQSELLWELSTARNIVAQTHHDKAEELVAAQLQERSLKIAQEIAFKNPDFEDHAQAMFFTGYAQITLGKILEGTRTLQEYVAQSPRDAHAADAYRILADLQFDSNHFSAAEALYEKILGYPDSPIVGYALYKIGWCAYNLKDFGRALLGLEQAVRWAAGGGQNHLLSLKRESRHDLIALYAEVGDYRKALDYFSRFFQGDTVGWISDLAKEFDRIGQYEKSSALYKTLIALEPVSNEDIARQAEIIDGDYHLHEWDQVVADAQKLVHDYGPQLTDPVPLGRPAAEAEKILRQTALAQLYEYQKDPNPDSSQRVTKLDALYLSAFGKWPQSEEPLYRHAQFLLLQKMYPQAAEVFRKHWLQFKPALHEPTREEALRNLIFALDQSGDVSTTGPELLRYTQEYETQYPKNEHTRAIRFLRSTVFFKQARPEDGIRVSQALFDENPSDDIGGRAFKNLRVAYYGLKDWQRTYSWAGSVLQSKNPAAKLYADDLETVRMESLFQWAEQTKDDVQSAQLFLRVAHDPAMLRLRDKAYYNAFVRYHKASHDLAALDVANELQAESPEFGSLSDISGVRAALYQEAGDYIHAYPLLIQFVSESGKSVDSSIVQKAKMNLALISEALGKNAEAIRRYHEVLGFAAKGSPSAKEAQRALERLSGTQDSLPPDWAPWAKLKKAEAFFERHPIPARGDLPEKIKKGGALLEKTAQLFVDTSSQSSTPAYFAFEAYCSLPFLYTAYAQALTKLPDEMTELKPNERAELQAALAKVTDPIQSKIHALADECVSRSADSRHEGPVYRAVLEKWGWRANANLKKRADSILSGLQKLSPWLDPVAPTEKDATEDSILKAHLNHEASEESWYALARLRSAKNEKALSRLTLVDGLALYPSSSKILNALAVLDQDPAVYEDAAQKGSGAAWANLAMYHLAGGRLKLGEHALEQGLLKSAFDRDPSLKTEIQELVKEPKNK